MASRGGHLTSPPTTRPSRTSWPEHALNLIRKFADRASARVPERPRRRGRPPVPARDVAKALLLQACFGVSDRVAAGLVRLFKGEAGHLDGVQLQDDGGGTAGPGRGAVEGGLQAHQRVRQLEGDYVRLRRDRQSPPRPRPTTSLSAPSRRRRREEEEKKKGP